MNSNLFNDLLASSNLFSRLNEVESRALEDASLILGDAYTVSMRLNLNELYLFNVHSFPQNFLLNGNEVNSNDIRIEFLVRLSSGGTTAIISLLEDGSFSLFGNKHLTFISALKDLRGRINTMHEWRSGD